MIREGRVADLPRFIDLCGRLRDQMETYPNCAIDRETLVSLYGQCLNSALGLVLFAEHDGRLTGMLLAVAQSLCWSKSREATDLMFYAEVPGDGLKMGRRFIQWAWSIPKVEVVTMAHSFGEGMDQVLKLHERLGLSRIGHLAQLTRPAVLTKAVAA